MPRQFFGDVTLERGRLVVERPPKGEETEPVSGEIALAAVECAHFERSGIDEVGSLVLVVDGETVIVKVPNEQGPELIQAFRDSREEVPEGPASDEAPGSIYE